MLHFYPAISETDAGQAGWEPLTLQDFDNQLIIKPRVPNLLSFGEVRNPVRDNLFIINIMWRGWFPTSCAVALFVR